MSCSAKAVRVLSALPPACMSTMPACMSPKEPGRGRREAQGRKLAFRASGAVGLGRLFRFPCLDLRLA